MEINMILSFFISMKKRRKKRVYHNWIEEIQKGNTNAFYNSTEWDILREQVLERDKHTCQFFLGKWSDGKHKPYEIKIIEAKYVHHIISIKENPLLALDINNCISLSFEAHEIIEDRICFLKVNKNKKIISEEKW